jgi:Spy/CpxP family protein refolding chaperone
MSRLAVVSVACAVLAGSAVAQHHAQSYAGLETRAIKALSEEQLADLRAGRGMGFALAAELNGYPGPRHVIELADQLDLGPAQREAVQELFAAMLAETVPLGEKLIAEEAELDRLFAERVVTVANLHAATEAIGETQAALRAAHLKYHLSTAEFLTPEQAAHYARLRGYRDGAHEPEHSAH